MDPRDDVGIARSSNNVGIQNWCRILIESGKRPILTPVSVEVVISAREPVGMSVSDPSSEERGRSTLSPDAGGVIGGTLKEFIVSRI
jgi:hypothetical protein